MPSLLEGFFWGEQWLFSPKFGDAESAGDALKQGKLRHFIGRDHKDEKLKGKMEESSRPPLGEIRVIIRGT